MTRTGGKAGGPGGGSGDAARVAASLGALVRAGLTPAAAFEELGWPEIADDGAPMGPTPPEVALAARLAHATGSPLAPVLDALGARARADRETELAREAVLAGPRLSARILTLLPAVGVGLAVLVDVKVVRVLGSPLGALVMIVAGVLAFTGNRWMRRLVRRAEGPDSSAVSPAVVATALRAAMDAGQDVRGALVAVGTALRAGSPEDVATGAALTRAALVLGQGGGWDEAWSEAPAETATLARALRLAWLRGAAAGPMLAVAADEFAFARREATTRAAGELGVRLALPLAVCLLPAFVVGGIVPLLVSLVGGLR